MGNSAHKRYRSSTARPQPFKNKSNATSVRPACASNIAVHLITIPHTETYLNIPSLRRYIEERRRLE
jgi:hypothetical protein